MEQSIKYKLSAPFEGAEGEVAEITLNCPRGKDLRGVVMNINIDPEAKTFRADYDEMVAVIRKCCSEPGFADLLYMPDVLGAYQQIIENFTVP